MQQISTHSSKHKRIEYLDLARGIGQILVCMAHSKMPRSSIIYLFHMPFFFILSGYLHNTEEKYISFIRKRILNLYVPFVFWNLLTSTVRYFMGLMLKKTYRTLIFRIFLTLDKDGTLMGATWFLPALMLASVAYKTVETLFKKVRYSETIIMAVFIMTGITGFCITLPHMLSRTLILSMFYAFGSLLRKRTIDLRNILSVRAFVAVIVLFCILRVGNRANMGANQYSAPLGFIITSLCGTYFVFYVSCFLESRKDKVSAIVKRFILMFSKWSVYIILFQFIGAFIIHICLSLPLDVTIAQFIKSNPAVGDVHNGKWLFYFLGSAFIPILLGIILNWGPVGTVLRFLHVIPDVGIQNKANNNDSEPSTIEQ